MPKIVLKTAIVLDPMGHNWGAVGPEEEAKEHVKNFSEILYPAVINAYQPGSMYPGALKPGTDLVLFDYGGMMAGNSLMEDNSRHLIRYAQDNPNTLCIVVSGFTWRNAVAYEIKEQGLTGLHNLVCEFFEPVEMYSNEKEPENWECIPKWFRDMHNLPRVDQYEAHVAILKQPKKRGKK
jgi:hypothetical protein